jgi:hypothetical protein
LIQSTEPNVINVKSGGILIKQNLGVDKRVEF